jgi:hypothetical protein
VNGRPRRLRAALLAPLALGLVVAACSAGATAAPASISPSPASPTPTSAPVGFVIRASWTQALPPRSTFGNLPQLVVTTDGRILVQGAVIEIYPGPLVAPVIERPISPRGVAALIGAAKDAGILRVGGDFTGGATPLGAAAARLQIVADGVSYDLVGDANAAVPCPPTEACAQPVPGTPAAFAAFWYRLLDMASWLEPELGGEQAHLPASYAVIVGPPPEPWPGAVPLVWPVVEPALGAFGAPVRGEPGTRCGIAAGDLALALRPLLAGATQLTPIVATASASATHGLTVRPLPGDEDPCAPIVE